MDKETGTEIMANGGNRKRNLEDLADTCKSLVDFSKKKFRYEQPENSAGSVPSDDSHIIFYKSFLQHPIKVDTRLSNLSICPLKWAEAFLKMDLKSIAIVLCEALFTEKELTSRKQPRTNAYDGLPPVKKVAIARAAKWMLNKNQDPWTFKPTGWPNEEEMNEINKAFAEFERVEERMVFNIDDCSEEFDQFVSMRRKDNQLDQSYHNTSKDRRDSGFSASSSNLNAVASPDMMDYNSNSHSVSDSDTEMNMYTDHSEDDEMEKPDDALKFICISVEFPSIFKMAMDYVEAKHTTISSALLAKKMTQLTIPQNNDIFVDAVQFSLGRWAKALGFHYIGDIAYTLFRKYYRIDKVAGKSFNCFNDLEAPKRLAVIRACAWIRKFQTQKDCCITDMYSFDSSIPEHNVFLLGNEIEEIGAHITKKIQEEKLNECGSPRYFITPNSYNSMIPVTSTTTAPQVKNMCIVSPLPPACVTLTTPLLTSFPPITSNFGEIANDGIKLNTNTNGDVVIAGHTFEKNVWTQALNKYKLDDSSDKAAKYLFDNTFTDWEISGCNISGRGKDRLRFPEVKVNAILEALVYMKCISQNKSALEPMTKSEKKSILVKVFTEHANYRRRGLKQRL